MLNLVKKIIAVVWVILCFDILKLFIGELKNFAYYDVWNWIGFTIIAVLLTPIVVGLLLFLRRNQCPHCKKIFTMKKESTSKVGEEDISILTEGNSYNLKHEKIGTVEQYVSGKRITYKEKFVCNKCGKSSYRNYSKDKKNI